MEAPGRAPCNSFSAAEFPPLNNPPPEALMANSSFETFKQGGQAIEETAKKTGEQAQGVYEQAKNTASDVYDKTTEYAGDAMTRAQDSASELDEMVSEQIGRHPKAMVALGIGIGFALGLLFSASRIREPSW